LAEQPYLKIDHFVRDAVEQGQFRPLYRRACENVPVRDVPYEMDADLFNRILDEESRCTHEFASTVRSDGPPGWRRLDTDGQTVWRSDLKKKLLHEIKRRRPLSGTLADDVSYRYETYREFSEVDSTPKMGLHLSVSAQNGESVKPILNTSVLSQFPSCSAAYAAAVEAENADRLQRVSQM